MLAIIIVAVVMVLACAAALKKISREMRVKIMLAEDLKSSVPKKNLVIN